MRRNTRTPWISTYRQILSPMTQKLSGSTDSLNHACSPLAQLENVASGYFSLTLLRASTCRAASSTPSLILYDMGRILEVAGCTMRSIIVSTTTAAALFLARALVEPVALRTSPSKAQAQVKVGVWLE